MANGRSNQPPQGVLTAQASADNSAVRRRGRPRRLSHASPPGGAPRRGAFWPIETLLTCCRGIRPCRRRMVRSASQNRRARRRSRAMRARGWDSMRSCKTSGRRMTLDAGTSGPRRPFPEGKMHPERPRRLGSETRGPQRLGGRESYDPGGGRSGQLRPFSGLAPEIFETSDMCLFAYDLRLVVPEEVKVRDSAGSRFSGCSCPGVGPRGRLRPRGSWCPRSGVISRAASVSRSPIKCRAFPARP